MLQRIWKPIGLILSAVSFIVSVKEFHHRSGRFFPGSVLLLAVSVGLLYTIPSKSIRLLATRFVAFVLDLSVLSLFTYAIGDLLFRYHVVTPSGVLSLVSMWAWFLVFVLFDWRFHGTPGKLLTGLRLKHREMGKLDFVRCLLRSLLILIVPITIAGRITGILTYSKTVSFVLWSVALTLLSFLPISMAMSGGQSVVDLLLKIYVLPKRSTSKTYPASLDRRKWLTLVFASLTFGIILAHTSFPGLGGRKIVFQQPSFPERQVIYSGEMETRTAAALRAHMLKDPISVDPAIEDFKVYSVLGQLPSDVEDQTPATHECMNAFKTKNQYQIIHAKIDRESSIVLKTILLQNLIDLSKLYSGRPGYLVFEVVNRQTFGAFDIEPSEDFIYCLTGTDKQPESTLVGGQASIAILYSLQMPSLLILADLERYAAIEKVPVWPP